MRLRRAAAVPRRGLAAALAVTAVAATAGLWFVPANVNLAASAGNDIPPAFMPLLCAGVAGTIGAGMALRALAGNAAAEGAGDEDAGAPATPPQVAADLAVWGVSTVLVLLLMPRLGFVVTAALLLAAWLAYAGVRSWPGAVAVVAVLPALLDWLCWNVLHIRLP